MKVTISFNESKLSIIGDISYLKPYFRDTNSDSHLLKGVVVDNLNTYFSLSGGVLYIPNTRINVHLDLLFPSCNHDIIKIINEMFVYNSLEKCDAFVDNENNVIARSRLLAEKISEWLIYENIGEAYIPGKYYTGYETDEKIYNLIEAYKGGCKVAPFTMLPK